MQLTEVEKEAKDLFVRAFYDGTEIPCDDCQGNANGMQLPPWYDETKYERGRRLHNTHKISLLGSMFFGLFSQLADPKGRNIVYPTMKSRQPAAIHRRFVHTAVQMLHWTEDRLAPGSRAWNSLKLVRRMHLHGSNAAVRLGLGYISQYEQALTLSAMMMFPLLRPRLVGLQHFDRSDREAFVHYWAVIGSMLGVKDRLNPGLCTLEVTEQFCRLQMRTITFLGRRLVGIPGYQFSVDFTQEMLCRPIILQNELDDMIKQLELFDGYKSNIAYYKLIFKEQLYLYDVTSTDCSEKLTYHDDSAKLHEILELQSNDRLLVHKIKTETNWHEHLNDTSFKQLPRRDQFVIRVITLICGFYHYRIVHFCVELLVSYMLNKLRKMASLKCPK